MTRWDNGVPAEWSTTTEARYDDDERELWHALQEWEQTICSTCGNPISVCSDPAVPHYAQVTVCWARAAQQNAIRQFETRHAKASPDAAGYLPFDGRSIWTSTEDLDPDGDFLAG